ncbi:MAG: RNA 2'-phosphotransferase [Candidatus Thermoplasmatota archaeon]
MIRECEEHGYYRKEECPECGERGKFIMSDEESKNLGKTTAGVLRHFPDKYGLEMDERGWISLEHFVKVLRNRQKSFHWLRRYHVKALAATDKKNRYEYKDGKIRATYGHSIEVDLDLPTEDIPDTLYAPTTEKESELLLESGLRPSDRTYVHLSGTYESAVEAGAVRTENPVILEVDAKGAIEDGNEIMKAGKEVFIAEEIKAEYLEEHEKQPSEEEIEEFQENE